MEFEGQYLAYDEYKDLGGTLPEMPFNLLELEARQKINRYTFNRLITKEEQDEIVKTCVYKLIYAMSTNAGYLDANDEEKIAIEKHIIVDALSNYSVDNINVLYCGVE